MLFDTHCHAQFNAFKKDADEVVKKTLQEGVKMIVVGTQKDTSAAALALAEKYDGVWAAVGLHPNHLCEQEFFDDDELPGAKIKTRCEVFDRADYLELTKHPKCVAVGEFGLDYFHIPENLERAAVIAKQKETAWAILDLAEAADLPVIIHSRDAFPDQFAMLQEYVAAGKLKRRGVVHCFSEGAKEAMAYVELGFLVSFTGIITFPPKKGQGELSPAQSAVKAVPLQWLMVETDAPYLAPTPYRGQRCEPWMVKEVAKKVAELKGVSLDEVIEQTTKNAQRLFGIK